MSSGALEIPDLLLSCSIITLALHNIIILIITHLLFQTLNQHRYYEAGEFGIRIENVCITVEAKTANNFGGKKFCTFETVTMTPIKTSLMNIDMLDQTEIDWVNAYHVDVREKLLPLMKTAYPESVEYLVAETQEISK